MLGLLGSNDSDSYAGPELIVWLFPAILNFYAYGFTFLLQTIYWLFDFPAGFTSGWIEHIVSNYTFLMIVA